ncbi:MAG: hypothetical protein AAF228_11925 [Pseudomonadota bacterium]
MAITTFNHIDYDNREHSSFLEKLNKLFNQFIEARQKTAQHYVDNHLRQLDSRTLSELNFTTDEINQLKAGKSLANIR